jgi:hypothetical protein
VIAFLASPIARWAALAALVGAVALWGWTERAGRQVAVLEARAAIREANGLRETIRHMETRRAVEDDVARDPDPARSLRDRGWERP